MFTVRWTQRGAVREVKADNETAARVVADAIAAFYSGDGESVIVFNGTRRLVDKVS